MLTPTIDTVRVFLHVLAATVWVGGQITLLVLLPTVREIGHDAPRLTARAFNPAAWFAYGVLVVTGIWNLLEIDIGSTSVEYQATLGLKLVVVALSGIGAFVHSTTSDRRMLAISGAVGGVAALLALFLGVLLIN
jgi:putative copper export protein